jgi:hypothetical protein
MKNNIRAMKTADIKPPLGHALPSETKYSAPFYYGGRFENGNKNQASEIAGG